jgi:hypothetical protein
MAVSAILMFTSSDRTRGHGLLRAIDTGRLVFHVLATSGAECGAPGGAGPHAVCHHGAGGCRGTSRGRVGLDQGGARPDRPLGAPASTPRPAPTGGGFSGTGPAVRRFFHMHGESIALAVLWELARASQISRPAPPRRPPGQAGPPGQRGAQLNPGKPLQNLPWDGRILRTFRFRSGVAEDHGPADGAVVAEQPDVAGAAGRRADRDRSICWNRARRGRPRRAVPVS